MIGRTLSPYKILQKLGSGGMGEVYAAEDTELGRKVALKVLPPETASNEERRKRFEREARAVATLNHPNIVTVYSVEQSDGVHFITMELVEEKTLTEKLPKKGLPLNTAWKKPPTSGWWNSNKKNSHPRRCVLPHTRWPVPE
jgi:serine/threonine protein kinase